MHNDRVVCASTQGILVDSPEREEPGVRMRTHYARAIQPGTYEGIERKESGLSITEAHFINDI